MNLGLDHHLVAAKPGQSLLDLIRQEGLDREKLSARPIAAKIAGEVFTLNYVPLRQRIWIGAPLHAPGHGGIRRESASSFLQRSCRQRVLYPYSSICYAPGTASALAECKSKDALYTWFQCFHSGDRSGAFICRYFKTENAGIDRVGYPFDSPPGSESGGNRELQSEWTDGQSKIAVLEPLGFL